MKRKRVQPIKQDVFVPPHIENDPIKTPDEWERLQLEEERRIRRKRKALREKKRRIRQKRLRARRRRLTLIGAVLGVFALWFILRFLPVPFGAVIIDGYDDMTMDEIWQAAGIPRYVNVIQLSPDTMRDRLLQDLRIDDATVSREFPATIRITVKERKAAAVITTMYGFAYVDESGKVIDVQPQIKGVSVPLMTGKRVDTILLGDNITDDAIRAALEYLQKLSPEVLAEMAEINVGNSSEIIAYTTDQIPIHLGIGNDAAKRAQLTEELLRQVKDNNVDVQYIDTDPRSPLVKSK